jgi:hypothetical protein
MLGEWGDGTKFVPAVPPEATWVELLGPSGPVRFELRD